MSFIGIKNIDELVFRKGMARDSAGNYIFKGTALFENSDKDIVELPVIAKIYSIPGAPIDVAWRLTLEKDVENAYSYIIGEDDAFFGTKRDAMFFLKEIFNHIIYFYDADFGGYYWKSVSENNKELSSD